MEWAEFWAGATNAVEKVFGLFGERGVWILGGMVLSGMVIWAWGKRGSKKND